MSSSGLRSSEDDHRRAREDYAAGRCSFVAGLLPEQVLRLGLEETLQLFARRLGAARVDLALAAQSTDCSRPYAELARELRGPVADERDGGWLRRANVVGVNVRTIGSIFELLKYSLTLPRLQDAIHLLPIWEPGVVKSLYGPCSWELSQELYSAELAVAFPHLDGVGAQLRAVVNLLHLSGRVVGMDVIPHTDRYSQMALAFPEYFEWLRRDDLSIIDHRADLHEDVQDAIIAFLASHGPAQADDPAPLPKTRGELFDARIDEAQRLHLLFGQAAERPGEPDGREARRIALVKHLRADGYEPVPATMAPPYRGLVVDVRPGARRVDEHGLVWRDYAIAEPQAMSRVFGPLARYKLYARKDDNARWEIDFSRPRPAVWRYVSEHYAAVQSRYGFDFMRGDMSHVQMRPTGVPEQVDAHYDLLRAVKRRIQIDAPHFGYFAESFLAEPDVMGYGDELAHLEASQAEVTLGNLQSMAVDGPEFLSELSRYVALGQTRRVSPCLCMMTADKDDPRFDAFYLHGSPLRFLLGLFVGDLPSYMGLGFETRDVHEEPAPNEHYSKHYVFEDKDGPKATHGPYVWGENGQLFATLTRLRLLADAIGEQLRGRPTRWLSLPKASQDARVLAWTQAGDRPTHLFVANIANEDAQLPVELPSPLGDAACALTLLLSSHAAPEAGQTLRVEAPSFALAQLAADECRVYAIAD